MGKPFPPVPIPKQPRTVNINIAPEVFNRAYLPHLTNPCRVQIFYGGSSSGKSVFIAQRAVLDLLQGGRNYLVCREVGRTIRGSVFNQLKQVMNDWGVSHLFNINKSEMTITAMTGYQFLFYGLDDPEKLKSVVPATGVITDVWIEEATETAVDSVKQLMKRQRGGDPNIPKRMILSFNPILKTHWIYQTYFAPIGWEDAQTEYNDGQISILKTWYTHNRFLTPDDIADLLNEQDEYYRSVYTFGNWGILGNVIFTNWEIRDLSGMHNQFVNHRNGLDFGFSNDPAAIVATHYDKRKNTIYIYDEFYQTGVLDSDLATAVHGMIPGQLVIADSAEPKSITELTGLGVPIFGAKKGKDSVRFGIKWLKTQRIVIDKKCINAINEFQQYHWKTDRAGNVMPIPVDKFNHIIDALRYAYESESLNMPAFI